MVFLTIWLVGLVWMWSILTFLYVIKDREILDSRGWFAMWIFTGLVPLMNLIYAFIFTCMRMDRIIGTGAFDKIERTWKKFWKWAGGPVFPDDDSWRD